MAIFGCRPHLEDFRRFGPERDRWLDFRARQNRGFFSSSMVMNRGMELQPEKTRSTCPVRLRVSSGQKALFSCDRHLLLKGSFFDSFACDVSISRTRFFLIAPKMGAESGEVSSGVFMPTPTVAWHELMDPPIYVPLPPASGVRGSACAERSSVCVPG